MKGVAVPSPDKKGGKLGRGKQPTQMNKTTHRKYNMPWIGQEKKR